MEDFGLIEIDEDEIEKTRGTCPRCLRPVKVCLCEYIGIFINYNAYYINRALNHIGYMLIRFVLHRRTVISKMEISIINSP